MKIVTFASAPTDQPREAFQTWFQQNHVPALIEAAPSLCGGLVRRVIEPPDPSILAAPAPDPRTEMAPYDLVMELWLPTAEDFRREVRPLEQRLRAAGSRYISYAIEPRLQKDPRIFEAGRMGRRPEVTCIAAVKWLAGVSAEVAERHYREHLPVALRTQPVLTKYEQNLVREVISWTPGTPSIDAYSDFSFNSIREMTSRFLVTEEEMQDAASFVGVFQAAFLGDAEPFPALVKS
jgi:hypothetical protein